MKGLVHGGDLYGYTSPPIDFSVNTNPLGLPASVRQALFMPVSAGSGTRTRFVGHFVKGLPSGIRCIQIGCTAEMGRRTCCIGLHCLCAQRVH